MAATAEEARTHDPLASRLSSASDSIDLDEWNKHIPPRQPRVPQIRIGRHWFNILWIVPVAAIGLLILIAFAQALRDLPMVQGFIQRYPGVAAAQPGVTGFPFWVRLQHFFNMVFIYFIIRAGVQILADHPRLYWNRDCTPGTEWFRFSHPVPTYRMWTAKDDSVTLPGWLGIPGLRHSVGLARWWHFTFDSLWALNGIVFFVLLFATDQWQRIVPLTWDVLPNALSMVIQYASLSFPSPASWLRFNSLQQLIYFFTFFIVAPVQVVTGLMQGPAFSNRLGWFGRVINRQVARSLHFIGLSWFVFFIAVHGIFVLIAGFRQNTNSMFAGVESEQWVGLPAFLAAMAIIVVLWLWATPFTIKHARLVQSTGRLVVGGLKRLAERWDVTSELDEKAISPHFWPNHHRLPDSPEYAAMLANEFAGYRIRIGGLVEYPREFSLDDLKAMPKQTQVTTHFCIQGWSGVGKWGGVRMTHLLELVGPKPEAKFAVFYSMSYGDDDGRYYEAIEIGAMWHKLTMLAYEMNGEPLRVMHGAPLRLRCENELGFKQVKWIEAIEFVHDFKDLGAGQGGYNDDHEFYGYRMPL